MQRFAHINAYTVEEAISALQRYGSKASIIAGGTDILGKMKDDILPNYPEALINIKTIQDLNIIRESDGILRIGALATLDNIADHPRIQSAYTTLAQAAARTASPHIRAMGTIGGNICQDVRCWYYRNPKNRFPCLRKGGGRCYAIDGDSRYHSIFGGSVEEGCYAVHPSDTAPALVALNAEAVTSKRIVPIEDFFQVDVEKTTILDKDEIVTEIRIPKPENGSKSAFLKVALRKSIDFPIVNCAVSITESSNKVKSARICLNAVYVKPYRAVRAETAVEGRSITKESAEDAALAAVSNVQPMKDNRYMVSIAQTLVQRSILACRASV
jgi:xanthine dehydrogenase YagS FAD-binding subunit